MQSLREEDGTSEIVDPQDCLGSLKLEVLDSTILTLLLEPIDLAALVTMNYSKETISRLRLIEIPDKKDLQKEVWNIFAGVAVLMPQVVKSRDEIFSRWGYCDNHDLSRSFVKLFVKLFVGIFWKAKQRGDHLRVSMACLVEGELPEINWGLREVARTTARIALEFAPDYAFSVSLLLTPLCCDDIHDVTPRVSALAGCDKFVSGMLCLPNVGRLLWHSSNQKAFLSSRIFRGL
ncbi:hypothetical protein Tco_1200420 [Tanacetum coccineum]